MLTTKWKAMKCKLQKAHYKILNSKYTLKNANCKIHTKMYTAKCKLHTMKSKMHTAKHKMQNQHSKMYTTKFKQQNAHKKLQNAFSKMQNFKSTRLAIHCIGWASERSRERRARSVTKLLYHLQHSKLFTMPLICRRQAVCTPWALQNHRCCWINTPTDETKDWQRGVFWGCF